MVAGGLDVSGHRLPVGVGTPPVAGTVYLHSSTINNVPRPTASSMIYTSFGTLAPAGVMGAKARLFKEGSLCSATDYVYNTLPKNSQSVAVARDCGTGYYNSHGFVAVNNAGTVSEYVTFPTDPVLFTSTAALAAPSGPATNARGQSLGSAAESKSDSDLPDLVKAWATNGKPGYVKSDDLSSTSAGDRAGNSRVIDVYSSDGSTVVGQFKITTS